MKVAVITPYYKTPRPWLEHCHQSVLAQTHPCTQIFVADGEPEAFIDDWNAQHIVLHQGHRDFGDSPRAVGSISAIGQGFDAIAYLDSDNWFHPEHIESLVKLHERTGTAACTSNRLFTRIDGTPLGECPFSDADNFVDTSCYLLTQKALKVAPLWAFIPPAFHPIDDRMMLIYIKEHQLTRAFSNRITVAYRTKHPGDYGVFGEPLPPDAPPPEEPNPFAVARLRFQKLTGIDLKIRYVRPVRRFDGTFWDGTLA